MNYFELEILCPEHGMIEVLRLPNTYYGTDGTFEGDIRCGADVPKSQRSLLQITIVFTPYTQKVKRLVTYSERGKM
jgi:hypothetical protein